MPGLQLMKITGYTDKEYKTAYEGNPYSLMINPDTVKLQRTVDYNTQQAPDTSNPSQRYKSSPGDQLNFDVVIDCTGVVDEKRVDMVTEISTLEKIIYRYNGDIHRPNFVKIQWGKNITFKGVLTSFDISYTLFKPDGTPLRAKVSLAFSQYISPETVTKQDKPNSPDLTHIVSVTEGMTLPQLCMQTFNDQFYYIQVAAFNKLNKFRNLKGVRKLIFPPIVQPSN